MSERLTERIIFDTNCGTFYEESRIEEKTKVNSAMVIQIDTNGKYNIFIHNLPSNIIWPYLIFK